MSSYVVYASYDNSVSALKRAKEIAQEFSVITNIYCDEEGSWKLTVPDSAINEINTAFANKYSHIDFDKEWADEQESQRNYISTLRDDPYITPSDLDIYHQMFDDRANERERKLGLLKLRR